MVQNAAEGKTNVRSVNAGQGCSNTELRIVGNGDTLVYLTSPDRYYCLEKQPVTDIDYQRL